MLIIELMIITTSKINKLILIKIIYTFYDSSNTTSLINDKCIERIQLTLNSIHIESTAIEMTHI